MRATSRVSSVLGVVGRGDHGEVELEQLHFAGGFGG
jgi:hypothetical protein